MSFYNSTLQVEKGLPPYRYHQIAWKGFLQHQGGANTPFQVSMDFETSILTVRSTVKPQWPPYYKVVVTEAEPPQGEVHFTILLDPVRRNAGKERPIKDPSEVVQWAVSLLESAGIDILDMQFHPVEYPTVAQKGNCIPTSPWKFSVNASIVDPGAWARACSYGLGRKKRFGFGMCSMPTQAP